MSLAGAEHVDFGTWTLGFVYVPAVLFISMASFFTAKIGAQTTQRFKISILKKLLGCLNMALCLKMLYSVVVDF
jgi:uncharacterized membrane protein YfcA